MPHLKTASCQLCLLYFMPHYLTKLIVSCLFVSCCDQNSNDDSASLENTKRTRESSMKWYTSLPRGSVMGLDAQTPGCWKRSEDDSVTTFKYIFHRAKLESMLRLNISGLWHDHKLPSGQIFKMFFFCSVLCRLCYTRKQREYLCTCQDPNTESFRCKE